MVIEIVQFKLKSGVSESEFLAQVAPTFDWLETVDGYISRELLADEHGNWVDLVHWESMEQAEAAQNEMMSSPELGAAFASIDESTMQISHLTPQRTHTRATQPEA